MLNIKFDSFNLKGKKLIIEIPTEEMKGSIIMVNDKNALQSGWFKVVKKGNDVTECIEGQEAFIYFSHPPIFLEEIILQDKETQEKELAKQEEKSNSQIVTLPNDFNKMEDNIFKRQFAVVQEYDLIMTR